MMLGLFWHELGTILAACWNDLGTFWGHVGMGWLVDHVGVILGWLWGHFIGIIVVLLCWDRSMIPCLK